MAADNPGTTGLVDDLGKLIGRRADYSALPNLVNGGSRSPLDDGPAFAMQVIRKAIITGALKPGDAIRQDVMASALSLSKPPVREALRKLESEQLVVFSKNRGFVVAEESTAELREAWELRLVLEPEVLRMAAPSLTPTDLEQARSLVRALMNEPDYLEHFDLNLDFHLTLYRPSNRPHFLETIVQAHARTQRYAYRTLASKNALKNRPDDGRHEIIVDMLERCDVSGACACLAVHLKEAAEPHLLAYERVFELSRLRRISDRRRKYLA